MATLSPGVESEQLAQQCVQHAGTPVTKFRDIFTILVEVPYYGLILVESTC